LRSNRVRFYPSKVGILRGAAAMTMISWGGLFMAMANPFADVVGVIVSDRSGTFMVSHSPKFASDSRPQLSGADRGSAARGSLLIDAIQQR